MPTTIEGISILINNGVMYAPGKAANAGGVATSGLEMTQNFMGSVRAKFNVDMRQVHLNRRLGLVSGVISAVGTGIVYAYGGSLVQRGELTTGVLVALTFYIAYFFNPAVRVLVAVNLLE